MKVGIRYLERGFIIGKGDVGALFCEGMMEGPKRAGNQTDVGKYLRVEEKLRECF